jgi:hypothetical protein
VVSELLLRSPSSAVRAESADQRGAMGGRLEKVELDNGTRKRYPDSTPPSGEKEDTS